MVCGLGLRLWGFGVMEFWSVGFRVGYEYNCNMNSVAGLSMTTA